MNFSICLPSLGKYEALRKMLDSFERTTKYKNNIEFLIALDEGNTSVIKHIEARSYSFKIQFYERPRTKDFTNDYYNWLADKSNGDNIMVFNDDAWIRTNHWDSKILKRIKEIGRSLYLLDIPDTARIKYRHQFPCFPMVSRRAFCTLGFVLCPLVRMYPADRVTHEIYINSNLVFPVRNVLIEHEHVIESDESKKRLMDIYREDIEKQKSLDISEYIYTLLLTGSGEANKKQSKLQKIINILKEN